MAETPQVPAERVLGEVARLAERHGEVFVPALRLLVGGVWFGVAATTLYEEAAERHRALSRLLESVFDQVYALAARDGSPGVAMPGLAGVPLGGVPVKNGYLGIQVAGFDRLVGEFASAAEGLDEAGGQLAWLLGQVGLHRAPAEQVAAMGRWADAQCRDLRCRREMLKTSPRSPLVFPTSNVATFAAPAYAIHNLDVAASIAALAAENPAAATDLRKALAGDRTALSALLARQRSGGSQLPAQVNGWWKTLSAADQQQLITSRPQVIGRLDGLPAIARDQANRIFLAQEKRRLQARLDELTDSWWEKLLGIDERITPIHKSERDWIRTKLAGIAQLESRLARGGKDGTPLFLLGFDGEGVGHAIVSVGNPDTADNVVSYVPGLGTELSDIDGLVERADRLGIQARREDPNKQTASIVWLDYDPPQGADVVSTQDADRARGSLISFSSGLKAAHETPAPHWTLLGHSYGSLVAGKATVFSGGTIADDVIFIGSPGVGVRHVEGLKMPAGRVWAGTAVRDVVGDSPPIPLNPMRWLDNESNRFGVDPATQQFGASRFQVGPGSLWPPITGAHSSYWKARSDSLRNMARVVVGKPDRVQEASSRQPFLANILSPIAPIMIPRSYGG